MDSMPLEQDQVSKFFAALAVDPGALGLLVTHGADAPASLPPVQGGMAHAEVDVQTDPQDMFSLFSDCAKRGRWCLIRLIDGTLPPSLYACLRELSSNGHLAFQDRQGNGQDMRWPREAKIVLLVSADALEQVEVPTFLNLFGPILRET